MQRVPGSGRKPLLVLPHMVTLKGLVKLTFQPTLALFVGAFSHCLFHCEHATDSITNTIGRSAQIQHPEMNDEQSPLHFSRH